MMGETAMTMEGLVFWHWITFAVLVGLVLYPIGRILARIGFSPFWSVIALIPAANLAALWIVALSPWPNDKEGS